MPSWKLPNIRRGRMTPEDKIEIERLAGTMTKPTAGKIAAKINRHPATVNWFMLTRGLIEREPGRAKAPYMRGGKMIYPYTEEHDRRIEQLRIEQKSFGEIAEILSREFPVDRAGATAHSVQVRLVQLTAAPDSEVA